MIETDFADIPYVGVLVASLVNMVLGMVWFSMPLFGRPWMALTHPGKTQEDLAKGPKTGYVVALLASLVTALFLAYLLLLLQAETVLDAFRVAVTLWVGFIATAYAQTYIFGGKPLKLYLIDSTYYLVLLLGQALILVLWPFAF
ncbi:MAG TPA: DUF1761 domain-containing protein [Candidatus Thermoplasmatota archaeon]|nr:DUF1761 domain-containing protein [Candidatus Thermoplasmatota archaeon]